MRLTTLISLLFLIALALAAPMDWPGMREIRSFSFDTLQTANFKEPQTPTVILDIDERSLERYGQWPWPRDLMAEITIATFQGGAAVLGMDIVFSEADRTSPPRVLRKIGIDDPQFDQYDYDAYFAEIIEQVPMVLGYPFLMSGGSDTGEQAPRINAGSVVVGGEDPRDFLFAGHSMTQNIPELTRVATGNGFFNVVPDHDGKVRSVPLFIQHKNRIYPSLVMEILRVASGARSHIVKATPTGVTDAKVGAWPIPTDAMGRVAVNYRGGPKTFPYLSVSDLMDGNYPPELLEGAIVLMGTSAAGLLDLRATPVSSVFPGVEIHANLIDTIITGDFLVRPDWIAGAEVIYVLIVGAVVILLSRRLNAIWSGLAVLLFSAAALGVSFWIFREQGLLLNFAYLSASGILLFGGTTFMNYMQEEKEKAYIRSAFGQYLSPVVVEQLANNPEALSLEGEQKPLSIFFSDIRSFTTISESLDPRSLTRLLNQYMTPMTDIIMENQGTVDKFIGDAIMAFWNAPLDDERHADNALSSAVRMLHVLDELRPRWIEEGYPTVNVGIGINTGVANVGNMGSDNRFDYTVLGDAVNLAARLEGITKVYGASIVISEFTRDALQDDYQIRFLDAVKVKGKTLPVKIYQVSHRELDPGQLEQYNLMIEAYLERRWETAGQICAKLLLQDPDSVLYKLYSERIELYAQNPPPDDWDGSFTMTTK